MTERQLFAAIGYVDDELILEADHPARRRPHAVYWPRIASFAACACIFAAGLVVWKSGTLNQSAAVTEDSAESETALGSGLEDGADYEENAEGGIWDGATYQESVEESADESVEESVQESVEESVEESAEESAEGTAAATATRAVALDGVVYYETGNKAAVKCGTADGTITAAVSADAYPTEHAQSNFGTGYPYQRLDECTIAVEIDGVWLEFSSQSDTQE